MIGIARVRVPRVAVSAALALFCLACGSGGTTADEDAAAAVPALTLAELGEIEEARGFLVSGSVWSEDLSPTELRALINDLYDAGAARVVFADIEPIESQRVSALLAVELPADAAARGRVLTVYNRAWTALGEDAEKDSGQSWIALPLD